MVDFFLEHKVFLVFLSPFIITLVFLTIWLFIHFRRKKVWHLSQPLLDSFRKIYQKQAGQRQENRFEIIQFANILTRKIKDKKRLKKIYQDIKNENLESSIEFVDGLIKKEKNAYKKSELYMALGVVYCLFDIKKAIQSYNKAIEFNKNNLRAWVELGSLELINNNEKKAQEYLEHMFFTKYVFKATKRASFNNIIAILNYKKTKYTLARAYSGLSKISVLQGDLKEAVHRQKLALDVLSKTNFKLEEAKAYNNIGAIYRVVGSYEIAEEMHEIAIKICKKRHFYDELADSLMHLAKARAVRQDFITALDLHQKALEENKKIKRTQGVAFQYSNIGLTYLLLKNPNKAIENYQKALKENKKTSNLLEQARNYKDISECYVKLKDYKKAKENAQNGFDIFLTIGYEAGIADCLGDIAISLQHEGDFAQAEQKYLEKIKIEEKLERKEEIANAYSNLGLCYMLQKKLDKAEHMFNKALDVERQNRRIMGMGSDYANLGNIYKNKGQMGQATRYWYRGLKYYEQAGEDGKERAKELVSLIKEATEE